MLPSTQFGSPRKEYIRVQAEAEKRCYPWLGAERTLISSGAAGVCLLLQLPYGGQVIPHGGGENYTWVRSARFFCSPIFKFLSGGGFGSITSCHPQEEWWVHLVIKLLVAPHPKTQYHIICKENNPPRSKKGQKFNFTCYKGPWFWRFLTNVLFSDVFQAIPTRLTSSFFLTHKPTQNTHALSQPLCEVSPKCILALVFHSALHNFIFLKLYICHKTRLWLKRDSLSHSVCGMGEGEGGEWTPHCSSSCKWPHGKTA